MPAKKTTSKAKSTPKKSPKKTTQTKTRRTTPTKKNSVATKVTTSKPTTSTKPKLNSKYLSISLVVVGIALLTYKLGPWFVPAIVNNKPITRFKIWSRMEKSFGAQTLDDLVSEYTLEDAIKSNNIKVDETKVQDQLKSLESQFESVGGLDTALSQRGLSRADLEKQIRTQLAVEQILADKVEPTETEIKDFFDKNADTTFADKQLDEVRDSIVKSLKDSKLQSAFLDWFAQVKKDAKVKNFGL